MKPSATALAQRDSIMKAIYLASWTDPSPEAETANVAWLREFYKEMYAHSGGVPVPDEVSDGAYINYPDIDLADPEWNTSGVPWHAAYGSATGGPTTAFSRNMDLWRREFRPS